MGDDSIILAGVTAILSLDGDLTAVDAGVFGVPTRVLALSGEDIEFSNEPKESFFICGGVAGRYMVEPASVFGGTWGGMLSR
jgi:hypothetical protein